MEILTKAVSLILSLSILVVLHELGHFIPAKLFKTKVEKFYLFFDWKFSLFKKKFRGTEYGIGWLPLGGYVKIAGMVDESMDKEQMKKAPEKWEFRSKPTWQRLIIMVGGVTVNAVLAFFIYSMSLYAYGEEKLPLANLENGIAADSLLIANGFQDGDMLVALDGEKVTYLSEANEKLLLNEVTSATVIRNGQEKQLQLNPELGDIAIDSKSTRLISPNVFFNIEQVMDSSGAANAGLQKGDQIIAFNGVSTPYYASVKRAINDSKQAENTIQFLRDEDTLTSQITLQCDGYGNKSMGVAVSFGELNHETYKYSFFEAIPAGWNKSINVLTSYVKQFKKVTKHADSIGGFGAIGSMFPESFSDENYWEKFWSITAFLSIMLAFMNLLPIPALDGGHVMFLIYEMITGRKPKEKLLEYAQIAGMVLLLSVVLYANGQDLFKAATSPDVVECWPS